MPKMSAEQLQAELSEYSGGSDDWYIYRFRSRPLRVPLVFDGQKMVALLHYSAGVRHLARNGGNGGAYWLIDLIASLLPTVVRNERAAEKHFWYVRRDNDGCVVECRADTHEKPVARQKVPYTDLQLPEVGELKLYGCLTMVGGEPSINLMLPSEY